MVMGLADAKGPTVFNEHERVLPASPETVGALLDKLGSDEDELWPSDLWPPMRMDRGGLEVGATGGHGPIRYRVAEYDPGRAVEFRFTGPPGFLGSHEFLVERTEANGKPAARLRHVIALTPLADAKYKWPLFYRPLHDALMEDLLDRAEARLSGRPVPPPRWSWWVKLLRSVAMDRYRSAGA